VQKQFKQSLRRKATLWWGSKGVSPLWILVPFVHQKELPAAA